MYKTKDLTVQEFQEKFENRNVVINWRQHAGGEIIINEGKLSIDTLIAGSEKIAILSLKKGNIQERINVKLIDSIQEE